MTTPDNTIHTTTYTISHQVELAVSHTDQRTWVRSSRYGHDAGPGRTVHELVMLTAGKPYYVRVRYRDQMGWSASSKTAHFGLRYVLVIQGRDECSLFTPDWYSNIGLLVCYRCTRDSSNLKRVHISYLCAQRLHGPPRGAPPAPGARSRERGAAAATVV